MPVCVRAATAEEAETALNTMRQFAPLEIDRLDPTEEQTFLAERQQPGK